MVIYIYPIIPHQEFFTLFSSYVIFQTDKKHRFQFRKIEIENLTGLWNSQIWRYLIILGTLKNFLGIKPLQKLMVNLRLLWKDLKIVKVIISTNLVTDSFRQFQVVLSDIFYR